MLSAVAKCMKQKLLEPDQAMSEVAKPVSYTHLDVYKRQGSCGVKQ